jgi:YrhK-like protein
MYGALRTLVQEFGWIHTGIGLLGNIAFVAGSILFLPVFEPLKTFAVWLFIVGATLMLIGNLGDALVKLYEARNGSPGKHARETSRSSYREAASRP